MRSSIESARIADPRYSMTCLGGHARLQLTLDGDRQGLGLVLQQRLRGQHVRDLAGADAEGQRAERAVRRGVAVAADDRVARLRDAQLRPDDVHDALPLRAQRVQLDAEVGAVLLQLGDLRGRGVVQDGDLPLLVPGRRGRGVIHRRHGALGAPHLQVALAQPREGLRRGDLVDEVQVDVQDGRRVGRRGAHEVRVPDLLEQRPWHGTDSARIPPPDPVTADGLNR
jgi:hypothetical protein